MPQRRRYLIVDGHSLIFAGLSCAAPPGVPSAREALIKQLRHYQDWTGVSAGVVFDGKDKVNTSSDRATCRLSFATRTNSRRDYRAAQANTQNADLTVATSG
jgi:predicted RNA-binding protein with PIN domain